MAEFEEVRRSGSWREAEQLALVLAAMEIGCRLAAAPGGVALLVPADDVEAARWHLKAYERENAPRRRAAARQGRIWAGWPAAIVYALVLLLFFGAERRDLWSVDWLAAGAARGGLIDHGQWWRAVTALTLHVDHGHLLGNIAAGLVFGALAAQLVGPGLAWLAILLAGTVGNLLSGLLRAADYTAVGASTAVFGALGIVSGYTRRRRWIEGHLNLRRLAPIGAGILLLVHFGFGGERTDVGAHVLGFLVGAGFGWALAHWSDQVPNGERAQSIYGAVALGMVVLAWGFALGAR
ncbi:MAG: rhomboid family intramembrane serine protease [Geminicoccaceae bacterium]